MAEDLGLPDELFGFGGWLLWVLATRATAVVDRAFAVGPARPSRHYGLVDGHPVPTPSLVAWLLAAAERGLAPEELAGRDAGLDERQKVLRTIVSRAVGGEPRLFKDPGCGSWDRCAGWGQRSWTFWPAAGMTRGTRWTRRRCARRSRGPCAPTPSVPGFTQKRRPGRRLTRSRRGVPLPTGGRFRGWWR